MSRLFLIFLFILSGNSLNALTPDLLELPRNNSYYSEYYKRYYSWYTENIFDWSKELNTKELEVIKENINQYNHWYSNDKKHPLANFLIGIGHSKEGDQIFHTIEVFIKSRPSFINEYQLDKELKIIKLKWNTSKNTLCLLDTNMNWSCFNRETKKLIYTAKQGVSIFYRGLFSKFSIVTSTGVNSTFHYSDEFHQLTLPLKLRPYVSKHGVRAFLPFDKIEESSNKEKIIYYP